MKTFIKSIVAMAVVASLSGCIDKEAKAEESSAPKVDLPAKVKVGEVFEYNDIKYRLQDGARWEPYTRLVFDTYDPYTGKDGILRCLGSNAITTPMMGTDIKEEVNKHPLCRHFNVNDRSKRKDFTVKDTPKPVTIDSETTWVPYDVNGKRELTFYYKGRTLKFHPEVRDFYDFGSHVSIFDQGRYFVKETVKRKINVKEVSAKYNTGREEYNIRGWVDGPGIGEQQVEVVKQGTKVESDYTGNRPKNLKGVELNANDIIVSSNYDDKVGFESETFNEDDIYRNRKPGYYDCPQERGGMTEHCVINNWSFNEVIAKVRPFEGTQSVTCVFDGGVRDDMFNANSSDPNNGRFVDEPVSSEFCQQVIDTIYN